MTRMWQVMPPYASSNQYPIQQRQPSQNTAIDFILVFCFVHQHQGLQERLQKARERRRRRSSGDVIPGGEGSLPTIACIFIHKLVSQCCAARVSNARLLFPSHVDDNARVGRETFENIFSAPLLQQSPVKSLVPVQVKAVLLLSGPSVMDYR